MTPVDLEAMAKAAPAMRWMRVLMDWIGTGRPLTQTGRMRRADALALVDLLETRDILDPRFPIHSSSELHWLNLWVEWAKACRLARVVHGRIVPVGKNAKLLDRPLVLVTRMLEALPRLGDELGHSVVTADAAHTVEFGEMSTLMNYMFQSFNFRFRQGARPFYDLVANIAAEEFGHVELVAATINTMLTGAGGDRAKIPECRPHTRNRSRGRSGRAGGARRRGGHRRGRRRRAGCGCTG